jgi:hypothetical protein
MGPPDSGKQSEVHRSRSVHSRDKVAAVLKLLAGEDPQTVANSLNVSLRRVTEWKDNFVEGGQTALQTSSRKQNIVEKASDRSKNIAQWSFLVIALAVVIFGLVWMLERRPSP